MSRKSSSPPCPCGHAQPYEACCGRYIDHFDQPAPSAEALMRSRYTAYTLKHADYLLATWHPDVRPNQLDLSDSDAPVKWLGLDVLNHEAGQPGDLAGIVEFVARYKVNGRAYRLHEISRFDFLDGRWYYRDGDITD